MVFQLSSNYARDARRACVDCYLHGGRTYEEVSALHGPSARSIKRWVSDDLAGISLDRPGNRGVQHADRMLNPTTADVLMELVLCSTRRSVT